MLSVMLLSSCDLVENAIDLPNPSPAKTSKASITRVLIPEHDLVYRNEIAGYQITFPEHWRGYYIVTEYSSGDVCVGFYGKSKTGQISSKHDNGRDGIDMFWIVTELPPEVEGIKDIIGKINGVEYLYGRWGGISSPILTDVLDPNHWMREYIERELGYKFDETELELVAEDRARLIKIIQEDLWHSDSFLKTFKAIE
jgi:hypothetical protein